eukprot:GDKI01032462.1.p2 GENE.GDKI01032462.1~~GDKI01032462.1.p2  ORF type:complete len:127 (-),score=40.99 GDKI01032462.1:313-693(-)
MKDKIKHGRACLKGCMHTLAHKDNTNVNCPLRDSKMHTHTHTHLCICAVGLSNTEKPTNCFEKISCTLARAHRPKGGDAGIACNKKWGIGVSASARTHTQPTETHIHTNHTHTISCDTHTCMSPDR